MTMKYIRTEDNRLVAVPQPIEPEEEQEDSIPSPPREDLEETQVTHEDIMGDQDDNPPLGLDDEDMDDLFGGVSNEPADPKPIRRRLFKRTNKPYPSPTFPNMLGQR